MLQQQKPDDYVVATGETHSVREFVEHAFAYLDMDWRDYVQTDQRYIRPLEVDCLRGDFSKAAAKLQWCPVTKFRELVRIMVDADLKRERILLEGTAKHNCAGVVV